MYVQEKRGIRELVLGLLFTSQGTALMNGQSYLLSSSQKTRVKQLVRTFEGLARDLKEDDDHEELFDTGDTLYKLVQSFIDVSDPKELDEMTDLIYAYKQGKIDIGQLQSENNHVCTANT